MACKNTAHSIPILALDFLNATSDSSSICCKTFVLERLETNHASIWRHTKNVGEKTLHECRVTLVCGSLALGFEGADSEHVGWLKGSAKHKTGRMVDSNHH
jgi:hypothetical protein